MLSDNINFYYVVGGNDSHYKNLKLSIDTIRNLYPESKIIIGDFDYKFDKNYSSNLEVFDLRFVKIDKSKIYKHIIWQYKYFITQFDNSKYNLYLDTDTVLVNKLDNLIQNYQNKFLIAKHFYVPSIKDFKNKINLNSVGLGLLDEMLLKDEMDFCAAGVFFFEKNQNTFNILKETFNLHQEIYKNVDYIEGIYDEPILNSILQNNLNHISYVNGALNHCCMMDMPLKIKDGILYGKNNFDLEYEPITCLHCDISRRDPSAPFDGNLKYKIKEYFKI